MKKISALFLMAMPFALTASAQDGLAVSDPAMSPCKGSALYAPATRTAAPEEGEWLDYSVTQREDGLYLHFIHENLVLNCATPGVVCTAKVEGDVITIDEREDFREGMELADCICLYDVTYDVGPLQEGDYTLIVTYFGQKRAEMSVHIATPLRGRFNVDAFVSKIEKTTLGQVKEADVIYDLNGRRYKTFPHPGVFIKGGSKIFWKGELR